MKIGEYLFVNGGPGGVYRSIDNGGHWTAINFGLPAYPHCYAIASTGTTLYASIYANGVYKSADFGNSWQATGNELNYKTFYSLLAYGEDVYAGYSEGGFYYSANGGTTWTKKGDGFGQVRNFLIAGGDLLMASSISGVVGVYKSQDKGDHFVNLNAPVTSINYMSGSDNVIYLTGGQPLTISRDYGTTWTTSDIGQSGPLFFNANYANEDRIILPGGNTLVFVSEDEGLHWQTITTPENPGIVSAVYGNGSMILLGSRAGIYGSDDNGQHWREKNDGLNNHIITQLTASEDNVLFAGTAVGVFSSVDDGITWNKRNNGLNSSSPTDYGASLTVKGIYTNADYTIVATRKGIYRSMDDGLNWVLRQSLQGQDLNNNFQVLAGDAEKIFACETGQQHYSTSSGTTWTTKNNPIFDGVGLLKAVVRGDTIIVLAFNSLILSKDFGNTWTTTRVTAGYFSPNDAVFANDKLYVATYQGLFETSDLISWNRLVTPATSIYSMAINQTACHIGTDNGVFVSLDQGKKWYPTEGKLQGAYPSPLVLTSTYGYAGTYGKSVWRMLLSDLNISPVITAATIPLQYTQNQEIVIDLENLVVTDPDNVFPNDFTLTILDGDHYAVNGNKITPDPKYNGELKVTVYVTDGRAQSNLYTVTVTLITGIEEPFKEFDVYPIPTHQKINFTMADHVKSYLITDLAGRRMLYSDHIEGDEAVHTVDVSELPQGIYLIEIQGQTSQHRRFIKY